MDTAEPKSIPEMTLKEAYEAFRVHVTEEHGLLILATCKTCAMFILHIRRLEDAKKTIVFAEAAREVLPPDGFDMHEFVGDGQNCVICTMPEGNPIHMRQQKEEQPG